MQIFFQNGDLKYFQVATTPYPRTLTAYPTPVLGDTPGLFFFKMTAKDVKEITYLPGVTLFCVWCNQRQTVRGW